MRRVGGRHGGGAGEALEASLLGLTGLFGEAARHGERGGGAGDDGKIEVGGSSSEGRGGRGMEEIEGIRVT